jgi:hypothetical protein
MSFSGNQYPNYADKVITTRGDIIRGSSTGSRERLGLGSSTEVLTSDGTDIDWAAAAGSPTTTKGDLSGFSTTAARIPISTNNYSLYADSAQALGLKWGISPTSVLSTTGDILYASGANTLARLASTTSGHVLTAQGAGVAPVWAAVSGGMIDLLDDTTITGSAAAGITFTPSSAYNLAPDGTGDYRLLRVVGGGDTDGSADLDFTIAGLSEYHQDSSQVLLGTGSDIYQGSATTCELQSTAEINVARNVFFDLYISGVPTGNPVAPYNFNITGFAGCVNRSTRFVGSGTVAGGSAASLLLDEVKIELSANNFQVGTNMITWGYKK